MKITKSLNIIEILLILIFLPFLAKGQDTLNPQHVVKVGQQATDFTLSYPDGRTQKLSDLKGKVVMLQFTASWCSVCLKEMPFIEKEIWQKNKDNNDFVLVGVDFKENNKKIKKFIKAAGITYPIVTDYKGSIFELYAEKNAGVTRNVIIDRDGNIAFLTRLFKRKEFDTMKKKIEELLKK